MAHNIDNSTGQDAMAYVGTEGTPWHGLGQKIEQGASIAQIRRAAGLGWRVESRPVLFQVGDSSDTIKASPDHQIHYRSDTQAVLTVTGKGWHPHQNDEVLEFFSEYLATGEMFIDTAGALNGGKQIWVLAKIGDSFTLPGKDKVEGYVLLMNPHEYGKGMIGKVTMVRVVCWNTLMAALQAGGQAAKMWHTAAFDAKRRQQFREELGIAKERFDAFKDDAKALTKLTLSVEDGLKLIAPVFKADPTTVLEQQGRTLQRVIELWQGAGMGAELASAKGTAWGLLNGVTQYFDHEYGRTDNARLTNAWLGSGSRVKEKAKQVLLAAA